MKLINKFTLVVPVYYTHVYYSGYCYYFFSIKKQLHIAAVQGLSNINNQAAEQLRDGRVPDSFIGNGKVEIRTSETLPAEKTTISEATSSQS